VDKADFDAAGAYAEQFEQAYGQASSDYVKAVLADGTVDMSELQEAQQRMVSCMSEAGFVLEFVPTPYGFSQERLQMGRGTVDFTDEEKNAALDADDRCREEWMGNIDTLYQTVTTNPNNEDWSGLVAACLTRHGLAPEGFTGQDYDDFLAEGSSHHEVTAGGPEARSEPISRVASQPRILPGGHLMNEPEVMKCMVVPLQ
jgi:hypothetical protein